MIIWTTNQPNSAALEQFIFCFRDAELSDLLLNACDLAFVPMPTGYVNMVVPRYEGVYDKLMTAWAIEVTPYYPYTDVITFEGGYQGITENTGSPLRIRINQGVSECITIFEKPYADFLNAVAANAVYAIKRLDPWFVYQDSTGRFDFRQPEPGIKHVPLTTQQNYAPKEYLEC